MISHEPFFPPSLCLLLPFPSSQPWTCWPSALPLSCILPDFLQCPGMYIPVNPEPEAGELWVQGQPDCVERRPQITSRKIKQTKTQNLNTYKYFKDSWAVHSCLPWGRVLIWFLLHFTRCSHRVWGIAASFPQEMELLGFFVSVTDSSGQHRLYSDGLSSVMAGGLRVQASVVCAWRLSWKESPYHTPLLPLPASQLTGEGDANSGVWEVLSEREPESAVFMMIGD